MVRSARAMVKLHPPKYRTANKTDNLIDRVTTYLEIFANLATIGKYQGEPCQGKLFIAFFATQVGVPINVGCCGPSCWPFSRLFTGFTHFAVMFTLYWYQ